MNDKKNIARRKFLESIGKAAGSAAMLRTMAVMGLGLSGCGSSSAGPAEELMAITNPVSLDDSNSSQLKSPRPGDWDSRVGIGKSVIILGAGIAGMTSAYELQKLGYTVSILEATNRAGGRNITIRSGDTVTELTSTQTCLFDNNTELYFNPGPARIAHHHEFLLGYCREFGVALENFTNDNRAALLHSSYAFNGKPQVAKTILADTRGDISELLALAINQNALDQYLTSDDKKNILNALKITGDLDNSYNYLGTSRAGYSGQETSGSRERGTAITPNKLQDYISQSGWQSALSFSHGINQQPAMLQPKGGMDKIGIAFASKISSYLSLGTVVKQIRKTTNGVKIHYEKNGVLSEIVADYCICTIPTTVLKNIPNDFSVNHQQEIEQFQYSSASKIAFQSRRFWEQKYNIYGGISWTDQPMRQMWYPSNDLGSSSGIIIGAYIWSSSAANTFSDQSPQERILSVLQQGNNLHSEYQSQASRGISVAWKNIPYQLGAYGLSSASVLLTPDENILFAGEHLSIIKGWQEGAILSSYHAINEIVKKSST